MRKVAILIAVELYADKQIKPVKYANADALAVKSVLQEHDFHTDDQTILINDTATRTLIKSRVRKVLNSLTEDDTVYFFYAGHGFAKNTKNYITCFDTQQDDLENTSIAVEWLFKEFKGSECNRIVLFLDSCESGMLASTDIRGIYSALTEDELKEFFEDSEHCICFAACKPGQYSYHSGIIKHGIWSYHLVKAMNAEASDALVHGRFLTSSSLQNYLKSAVPKTLRESLTGTQTQTPWLYGAMNSDILIADVSQIIEKRKRAANPQSGQLRKIRLYIEQQLSVKNLSGYLKRHHVPDSVNSATESFVAEISQKDISEDLDSVHGALRQEFGFKRKDLRVEYSEGSGSIITPYFDYDVSIFLNSDNPSEVIWQRQILNIRKPEQILTDQFDQVFSDMFDTLEFTSGRIIKVEDVIDSVEDLEGDTLSIDYDKEHNWCTIAVEGLDAQIHVTSNTIAIICTTRESPRLLIESFFNVQKILVDNHQIMQLPF